ncbi:MAG: hypothetical protein EBZ49_13165, partial [Proteobacteria bacterium]|nr:hypothetical protein [Pseudomonadota bacterium]
MGRVFHGILTNVNFALKTAFLLFSVFVLLVQSLTQLPSMGGDSTHRLTRSVNLPSTLEPPPLEEEPDLEPWDTHDVTLEFLETPPVLWELEPPYLTVSNHVTIFMEPERLHLPPPALA